MPRIDQPTSPIPAQLEGLHLFHFDGAPCAQRVRFALGEKGLSRGREVRYDDTSPAAVVGQAGRWVSRVVSLVSKDHMTPAYAAIHPNMVVPALVHDGALYLESMDIIEYLDQTFGGAQLIPSDADARAATMARVEQAKELHRSIRYVTFRWGLGRLAKLSDKERAQLAVLARQGAGAGGIEEQGADESMDHRLFVAGEALLHLAPAGPEAGHQPVVTELRQGRTVIAIAKGYGTFEMT